MKRATKQLRILRRHENQHFMVMGDSGVGKSKLTRQILLQAQTRGDAAVVLDPECEYVQEFYNPERGDWILNPKDERCPYWNIFAECTDEADAIAIANSLFPEPPADGNSSSRFFHAHSIGICAYLLAYGKRDNGAKPNTADFGYWLAHPDEIDKRIAGSEHEHTLTANAAGQRAAILGYLNQTGRALRMMPHEQPDLRNFTSRDWAKNRKGWIFITSTPDSEDSLRPAQTAWIDLLILRVMSMSSPTRAWFFLDELATLHTLPQLHNAITRMRKRGNPILIGIQNREQLEGLYGKKSKTIFSQCRTKFFFATSEEESAKSLSALIGEVEILRLKETQSTGFPKGRDSATTERVREPLVMASQIQGLDDMEGYFVQRGKVVKFQLPNIELPKIAPALIERSIPAMERRPLESETPPAAVSQSAAAAAAPLLDKKAKSGLAVVPHE